MFFFVTVKFRIMGNFWKQIGRRQLRLVYSKSHFLKLF